MAKCGIVIVTVEARFVDINIDVTDGGIGICVREFLFREGHGRYSKSNGQEYRFLFFCRDRRLDRMVTCLTTNVN